MPIKVDNIGGSGGGSGVLTLPEYDTDPASTSGMAWVLRSGGGGAADGTPLGLLLAITFSTSTAGPTVYEFSYKNSAGSIIRATLA